MKNTYIIAIKEGFEPSLLTIKPNNDITWIGKNYYKAYIMESKEIAKETRKARYKQREERKADSNYTQRF